MSMNAEVLKLVDVAIEEGTFSVKAAQGIAELREDHAKQEERIEKLLQENEDLEEGKIGWESMYKKEHAINDRLNETIQLALKREEDLVERERQCSLSELEMRLVREHKGEMINLTEAIFRNTRVRETLSKDRYIPDHTDSDGCWQAGRTVETETATTETQAE